MWGTDLLPQNLDVRRVLKVFSLALFLVIVTGCVRKAEKNEPEVLLSEQQMINLLTDVQIIEADVNYLRSLGKDSSERNVSYYEQLFQHYGINEKIFSENMDYYTRNVVVMERIMDSVLYRLTQEQRQIGRTGG